MPGLTRVPVEDVRVGQRVRRNVALYEGDTPIHVWFPVLANLTGESCTRLCLGYEWRSMVAFDVTLGTEVVVADELP